MNCSLSLAKTALLGKRLLLGIRIFLTHKPLVFSSRLVSAASYGSPLILKLCRKDTLLIAACVCLDLEIPALTSLVGASGVSPLPEYREARDSLLNSPFFTLYLLGRSAALQASGLNALTCSTGKGSRSGQR